MDTIKETKDEVLPPPEVAKVDISDILNRSFEAMWYQAEVLHKREMEKFSELDELVKRLKVLEEIVLKFEETIKDRIMMFSQDIIATMKDMRTVEQDRITLLFNLLLKPVSVPENEEQKQQEEEVEAKPEIEFESENDA